MPLHPNKHIREAIALALEAGWTLEVSNGHAFGHLKCPAGHRGGCLESVWSTPRNPEAHARRLCRAIERCTCQPMED